MGTLAWFLGITARKYLQKYNESRNILRGHDVPQKCATILTTKQQTELEGFRAFQTGAIQSPYLLK